MSTHIPFFITITKPNKHRIEVRHINGFVVENEFDKVKSTLLKIYQEEISTLPELSDDYNEFVNTQWFKDISADAEPINYFMFVEKEWVKPWSCEELYEEACEIVHKLELISGYINTENGFNDEEEEDAERNKGEDLTDLEEKLNQFKQTFDV